jgi:hypothetical protein
MNMRSSQVERKDNTKTYQVLGLTVTKRNACSFSVFAWLLQVLIDSAINSFAEMSSVGYKRYLSIKTLLQSVRKHTSL